MHRVLTGANSIKVSGITFNEWKAGILTREWISEDDRIHVRRQAKVYAVTVDGKEIGEFPSRYEAMKAGVKELG